MPELRYVARLGSDLAASGAVSDLDIHDRPGGPVLYATSRVGGTVTAYMLNDPGAPPREVQGLPGKLTDLAPLETSLIDFGGVTRAVVQAGGPAGLPAFRVAGDGSLGTRLDLDLPGFDGAVPALTTARIGGLEYLYAATGFGGDLSIARISETGLSPVRAPAPAPGAPPDLAALVTVLPDSGPILVAASATSDQILSYRVTAGGSLTLRDTIGAENGIGMNTPTHLATVTLEDRSFVLAGAAGSSSITVLDVAPDGTLTATDHVIDDLSTRFQSLAALDAIVVDGRAYVVAGGADDGVTLFTLLPTGRLVPLATLEDQAHLGLDTVATLTLGVRDGDLALFAGAVGEGGVTQLAYDLAPVGVTRQATPAAAALSGSGKADLLMGHAGNNTLRGGGGADILVGGQGRDAFWGGAGADLFVLEPADGQTDTIHDFEPGRDRIDLSAWTFLRSTAQLGFDTTGTGGRITFGDQTVHLTTMTGQALTEADMAAAVLDSFQHVSLTGAAPKPRPDPAPEPPPPSGTFVGTNGADTLTGTAQGDRMDGRGGADTLSGGAGQDTLIGGSGNDVLLGGTGDDILTGGPGRDALRGGAGRDQADYLAEAKALTVDLAKPSANKGAAAGDSYVSIEDLAGGTGSDTLLGTAGANRIWGHDGKDRLAGRDGSDTLIGGAGRDTLIGGSGNDVLFGGTGDDLLTGGPGRDALKGGAGRDQADYLAEAKALTVDLAKPSANTGAAAGDSYVSIEDLAGGTGSDRLLGTAEANRIWGHDGNDRLVGRGGGDTLRGGAGKDRLEGGPGRDLLLGGAGADTFVFQTGHDHIGDFRPGIDTIELSATLWSGALSARDVVIRHGAVSSDGVILDFGAASLTIDGLDTMMGLFTDLILV